MDQPITVTTVKETMSINPDQMELPIAKDTKTMTIKPDQVAELVAGDEMSDVKRLEGIHNVQITIKADITIEGPPKKVSAAMKSIEDCLPHESKLTIEEKYVDEVLSKDNKQAIMKAHNVRIKTHGVAVKEVEVVITGKKGDCKAAEKAFDELLKKAKKDAVAHQKTFILTEDQMDHIAKDKFSIFKTVEIDHCVSVSFEVSEPLEDGRYAIVVKGSSDESISAAKERILAEFRTVTLPVDEQLFGKIMSRGAGSVRSLEEEYQIKFSLKDGKAYISGVKHRTEAARSAIESIISDERKKISSYLACSIMILVCVPLFLNYAFS